MQRESSRCGQLRHELHTHRNGHRRVVVEEMAKSKICKRPECEWTYEKTDETGPLFSWECQSKITNNEEKAAKSKRWKESPGYVWACATLAVGTGTTHLFEMMYPVVKFPYIIYLEAIEAMSPTKGMASQAQMHPGPAEVKNVSEHLFWSCSLRKATCLRFRTRSRVFHTASGYSIVKTPGNADSTPAVFWRLARVGKPSKYMILESE